jgi:hypothetical protein
VIPAFGSLIGGRLRLLDGFVDLLLMLGGRIFGLLSEAFEPIGYTHGSPFVLLTP